MAAGRRGFLYVAPAQPGTAAGWYRLIRYGDITATAVSARNPVT
jgi:hypothetical protein